MRIVSNSCLREDSSFYPIFIDIRSEISIPVHRLNVNEIPASIWQRYERYRSMNRYSNTRGASSYPRTNYYRDYYTGNNYEDEYGTMLNNEYDDFGDDFFQQEENQDEFDMPFRKYGLLKFP